MADNQENEGGFPQNQSQGQDTYSTTGDGHPPRPGEKGHSGSQSSSGGTETHGANRGQQETGGTGGYGGTSSGSDSGGSSGGGI